MGECCSTKVVENSPDSSLDGTYNLASNGDKRDDICIDGCVYERDGLEYCFISKPVAESADVVCDDGFTGPSTTGSSGFPSTGSTGSGSPMSPVSMESSGSTETGPTGFTGSSGSTGSSGPTTTQSLDSLTDAVNQAREDADAALAAIAAADAAINAANAASSQLDSIDFSAFAGRRFKRQASSTTAYPVPTTCTSVLILMDDITTTLSSNPAGVTPLITALLAITTPLSEPCSADDINSLDSKKDDAKSTAEDAVAKQTNLKAAATEEYNAANEEIMSLNEQISAAGGTTIAAGTAAPTVATMFVEPTTDATGSTFTIDVTFTGSTFDGSSPSGSTFDGSSPTGGSSITGSTGTGGFSGTGPTGSTGDFTGSTGSGP